MATDRETRLVLVVLVVLAALFVVPGLGMGGLIGFGHMGGMWGWDGTMPWWMFFVGAGMQLLFLVVIAAGAYFLFRTVADSRDGTDEAMQELRRAYARGEMSDEEFERRRERLRRER